MSSRHGPPASALRVFENSDCIDVSVRADACRDLLETRGAGTRRYRQGDRRLRKRSRREVEVHLRRVATIRPIAINARPIAPRTPSPDREQGR
jgi:hypothetical protein